MKESKKNSDFPVKVDRNVYPRPEHRFPDMKVGLTRARFEANTVIMNPDEDSFLMFRFYGSKPELWERRWKLGDPELID